MSRSLGVLLPAALIALAMALPAAVAGHAELVSSEPAAGDVLPEPPSEVRGVYSEDVDATRSRLQVLGPDGEVVATGGAVAGNRREMAATLPADLPAGTYTVKWTTVSAVDNDVARGEFTFQTQAASSTPTPRPTATATASPAATPSPSPSPSPTISPSPAPTPGVPSTGGDAQVIVPIVAAAVLAVLLGLRLFRGRGQ